MTRRVVITGAASGIGLEIAQQFIALGDQVAICDVSQSALDEVKKDIPEIKAHRCDVSDPQSLEAFFLYVEETFGGVDVFISNAGTAGPAGAIDEMAFDDWQNCLNVNLNGAFCGCQWAARHMKRQKSGVILIMSSTSGLFGVPNRSPYVAAKWGLIGLMKGLAIELGAHNIRVNAICPGAVEGARMDKVLEIESAATGKSKDALKDIYTQGVSLRRFVTADEIAQMACYLASDAARSISGQGISVDGNTERMV